MATVFVILGKGFGDIEEAYEVVAVCADEGSRDRKLRELSDEHPDLLKFDPEAFKVEEHVLE